MRPDLSPSNVRIARIVAAVADAVQIMILPAFVVGGFSPFNAALDVAVAAIMFYLLGWHWALLPTFATEMVPVVDLAPTWTIAVFLATGMGPSPEAPSAPPPTPAMPGPTAPPSAPPQIGPGDNKA